MLMRSTTGSDWVLCHEMALIGTNNTDDGRPPASPTSSDTITCSSSFRRTPKSQARVETPDPIGDYEHRVHQSN